MERRKWEVGDVGMETRREEVRTGTKRGGNED